MVTKVTSDDFKKLVNPYTGKPMEVMMNVTPTGVTFFCPDTYSTSERMKDADACYRAWNRVNGVEGGRSGKPICCAYTGEPLSVVHSDFGCYLSGGFDPHMFYSREEFLYYATMRGGAAKMPKPAPGRVQAEPRRAKVTDSMRRHADREAPSLDEDKVHLVEKSMSKFKNDMPGSSTVSMSVGKRHGKR